ncbi:MAG: 2-oxo acid dehydrogenase subunit E2 [Firmicutes bacterium]|nr:2-oxo acid dehydrogenase subunit E2 [Bacillota bacterium]
MATELKLPSLAEGGKTGTVVKVLVSVGDRVEVDQGIVEVETEKAVVEVPSTVSGVVRAVHVREGDEVKEGAPLVTVDEDAAAEAAGAGGAQARGGAEGARATAPGAPGGAADGTAGPAQAAAAASAPAPAPAPTPAAPAPAPAGARNGSLVPAAPSVRRFARELGVDITQVRGTGPGGRISMDDVKAYVRERQQALAAAGAAALPGAAVPGALAPSALAVPLPDFSRWGEIRREKMSGVRKATAHHMARVWATVPQVTHFDEADVTEIERFRKAYGPRVEAAGGKLTVTAILLKVVAHALKVFPKFATSLDMAAEELIYKNYCHIGVAVDTEHGLLVPVIRDVDKKSLIQLAVELGQVAERARQRKLTPEDMQGGCFSISNLGGIGGSNFTPIVNAPEVAILGVSRTQVRPVYLGDRFEPRTILPLSLSYDHRVIDGADAARFLRWIVEALEHPLLLALEG